MTCSSPCSSTCQPFRPSLPTSLHRCAAADSRSSSFSREAACASRMDRDVERAVGGVPTSRGEHWPSCALLCEKRSAWARATLLVLRCKSSLGEYEAVSYSAECYCCLQVRLWLCWWLLGYSMHTLVLNYFQLQLSEVGTPIPELPLMVQPRHLPPHCVHFRCDGM